MPQFPAGHFLNRELSGLAFNERVLQEAEDPDTPPLDQLAFLGVVSSNLDEFVMIRLANLFQLHRTGQDGQCPTGMSAAEQIEQVLRSMRTMVGRQYRCFHEGVWPQLARHGLRRLSRHDLTDEQRRHLTAVFCEQVYPLLTPLAVEADRRFSRISDLTINLLVRLAGPSEGGPPPVAVVPLPSSLPRIILAPSQSDHAFMPLEALVGMFLGELLENRDIQETCLFRATRDGNVSVEQGRDEDVGTDFVDAMTDVLVQRRQSAILRLELADSASPWAESFLKQWLGVADEQVFRVAEPLDLKSYSSLAELPGLSHLRYPPWQPQPSAALPADVDIWQALRERDVLLHHPYESFEPVVRLIEQAAADRNVLAVKQVLYRTSPGSRIIAALEQAARTGKQVSVLVELKARFDEARNIEWARRLERAGAQVVYGIGGLKVHAKALLIVRREPDRIRRYAHLGTGNYNESTAARYTDFGLLTCDEDLAADVSAFFNMITGLSLPTAWRKITVAPRGLRQRLVHLIRRETERAQAGGSGLIMAKLNALADPALIEALYAASRAGVRVRLNVRGVCCLRPGVPGVSDHIEVVSVVDRFLEHSRALYFRNGGDEEVYLTSADWMPRNLDRRVETLVPVESPPLRKKLIDVLETCLGDEAKGRWLEPDGRYLRPAGRTGRAGAQAQLMQQAEKAAPPIAQAVPRDIQVIRPADRTAG